MSFTQNKLISTIHFLKATRVRPLLSKLLVFQDFQSSKLLYVCSVLWPNKTKFECIPVIFQHSSLTYCLPLVTDQNSYYKICSLAICTNIQAFNQVNRILFNILKTFLECLENYIVTYRGWLAPKSCLKSYVPRASSS